MVLRRLDGGSCFYIFFMFTSVDPVHALKHGHGHVLGVVVVVRVADLGWTFGWKCGAQKVALPFFVDRGHCIGMRDISNTSASSTLFSIFIQQIHSSP